MTIMDTTKIVAALADMQEKRRAIDEAIKALQSALAVLQGSDEHVADAMPVVSITEARRRGRSGKSQLDFSAEVLSDEPHVHIEELTKRVASLMGHEVSRATLDGGISREIRLKKGASRFRREAPGVYAKNSPQENRAIN